MGILKPLVESSQEGLKLRCVGVCVKNRILTYNGQELGLSFDAFCVLRFFINGCFKKASDHWRFQ